MRVPVGRIDRLPVQPTVRFTDNLVQTAEIGIRRLHVHIQPRQHRQFACLPRALAQPLPLLSACQQRFRAVVPTAPATLGFTNVAQQPTIPWTTIQMHAVHVRPVWPTVAAADDSVVARKRRVTSALDREQLHPRDVQTGRDLSFH